MTLTARFFHRQALGRYSLYTMAILSCATSELMSSSAQAQAISVTTTAFGTRDSNDLDLVNSPVNASECNANTTVTLRISGINSSQSVLDFWRGGNNCNLESERDTTNGGSCTNITASAISSSTDINGRTLIEDFEVDIATLLGDCSSSATIDVFILATNQDGSQQDVGNNWGSLQIRLLADPPDAPEGLSGGSGENQVSIGWDSSDNANILNYRIYLEANACTDGNINSSALLQQDAEVSTAIEENLRIGSVNGTSSSFDVSLDGRIEIGEEAAVGVAAVDTADNTGSLAVVCVSRIDTVGFCEQFAANSNETCPDDCNAGSRPSYGMLVFAGLLLLSLAQRRIRRARS